MIEELDMHILDLVQNAIAARATMIEVDVRCTSDRLILRVRDNGRGMDETELAEIEKGFYSTKSPRAVGLGIPFLKETAEECDGSFSIVSTRGQGTTVEATFRRDHIDLPPFGNLPTTLLDLVVMCRDRRLLINYDCDGKTLNLDTAEITKLLGDFPIDHPAVIRFLQGYINERIGGNNETGRVTEDSRARR